MLLHPDASGNLDWTSVFTVDEFNDHLQETYLSNAGFPGDAWVTQDLSAASTDTPPVAELQSSPASWSVAHAGFTSAYTVDGQTGDLEETYLPAMGDSWSDPEPVTGGSMPDTPAVCGGHARRWRWSMTGTPASTRSTPSAPDGRPAGDLPARPRRPVVHPGPVVANTAGTAGSPVTPTAVFHDGYTSVYTVDAGTGDLQETYLPGAGFPGDPWVTQDLSGPAARTPAGRWPGTSPVAIVHDGYVSVYTVDALTQSPS